MKISNLTVQYLHNPIGLHTSRPLLSYELSSEVQNQGQQAHRLLVASSEALLLEHTGDYWDSGKIGTGVSTGIVYEGKPLMSRERVYWKVMVWDKNGEPSSWSDTAFWEMGLLAADDWTARWIGQGDGEPADKAAAPQIAAAFNIPQVEQVAKARAYISGLGLYRASMNGIRLGEDYFGPGESDYSRTVFYDTFDITTQLRSGRNACGLIIGNGQYVNFKVNPVMLLEDGSEAPAHRYQKNDGGYVREGLYGDKKAIMQVEVTYLDGSVEIVAATDDTWRIADSPIVFNNWYGGEDYDATREIVGWDTPETDRSSWKRAKVMSPPQGQLKGRECGVIRIMEKITPVSVTRLPNGNLLVDMGRNLAGFPELRLAGMTKSDRGSIIRMYPAEVLNSDGTGVDQASCTQSWSERFNCQIANSYTVRGTGDESWHPIFCYQGFQYVEVAGFPGSPTVDHFRGCVLRMDNAKQGSFRTSCETLNRIHAMTERSIESNMYFSFTDCPQIEKLGWLETTHLMFRSVSASYDIRSWAAKIASDMVDAQTTEDDGRAGDPEPAGYMPAIAPEYQRIVGLHRDPNWGGACVLLPWEYYQVYGDAALLQRGYPTMLRYMSYLEGQTSGGLLRDYAQMGDWGQLNEQTPVILVANCAYYRLLATMSVIARLLGHAADEKRFGTEAEEVRIRIHADTTCYDRSEGRYGNGSQASYGCALFSGIIPPEHVSRVVEKLTEAVAQREYHLTSGEVGLKQVFSALATHGRSDVVYKMVMNDTQPSYKFFADRQLTTLPEYWNYEELWHGTMARSRNHAMMGHVNEWLVSYVLGIRPAAPGYGRVVIEPALTSIVEHAEGEVGTPYGRIAMSYGRQGKQFEMKVSIPVGVCADVGVPYGEHCQSNAEGSWRTERIGNTLWLRDVGSGTYEFARVNDSYLGATMKS